MICVRFMAASFKSKYFTIYSKLTMKSETLKFKNLKPDLPASQA